MKNKAIIQCKETQQSCETTTSTQSHINHIRLEIVKLEESAELHPASKQKKIANHIHVLGALLEWQDKTGEVDQQMQSILYVVKNGPSSGVRNKTLKSLMRGQKAYLACRRELERTHRVAANRKGNALMLTKGVRNN